MYFGRLLSRAEGSRMLVDMMVSVRPRFRLGVCKLIYLSELMTKLHAHLQPTLGRSSVISRLSSNHHLEQNNGSSGPFIFTRII